MGPRGFVGGCRLQVLLMQGRKFDNRVFVLVASFDPLIILFHPVRKRVVSCGRVDGSLSCVLACWFAGVFVRACVRALVCVLLCACLRPCAPVCLTPGDRPQTPAEVGTHKLACAHSHTMATMAGAHKAVDIQLLGAVHGGGTGAQRVHVPRPAIRGSTPPRDKQDDQPPCPPRASGRR